MGYLNPLSRDGTGLSQAFQTPSEGGFSPLGGSVVKIFKVLVFLINLLFYGFALSDR
jgi:hypothetical protein